MAARSSAASLRTGPSGTLLLALAALATYRLVDMALGGTPLHPDEAYYADWAREPAFGYYSKPPMIAWLIALSTSVLGETPFAVRLPALLCHLGAALALYAVARRHGSERAALFGAFAFCLMPGAIVLGGVMTTDAPLVLFWALALQALFVALETGRARHWALLGLWLGFGLMSKYTIGALWVSIAALLLFTDERRHLARPGPWLAVAVSAACLAPNLAWNALNGWPTVEHTAELMRWHLATLDWGNLLGFAAGQVVIAGPLVVVGTLVAVRIPGRTDDERRYLRGLWVSAVPLLAVALAKSAQGGAHLNWALPAWTGLALVAAQALDRHPRLTGHLSVLLIAGIGLGVALHHGASTARALGLEVPRAVDVHAHARGWSALALEVADVARLHPDARVLVDDRKALASLRFLAPDLATDARLFNPSGQPTSHYALVADLAHDPSRTGRFVLISRHHARAGGLARHFRSVRHLRALHLPTHADRTRRFDAFLVSGFRSY